MQVVEAVRWSKDGLAVDIIDQRLLPGELVRRELRELADVCDAIATLAVRGAPAIGIAGAMGLVVSLQDRTTHRPEEFLAECDTLAATIGAVRPTAVNLPWAMERMARVAHQAPGSAAELHERLRREATAILDEDRAMCRRIGEFGLTLIKADARIITHCNAGALATGGIGTALAPIYLAHDAGRRPHVYAGETRPLMQGSRLTVWELSRAGVDVTLMADNMAASVMAAGGIDLVIVGADRIAANGDVANKIGTYGLAVVARHHGVPFYVAAPWSTVDPATPTGRDIHIEQRGAHEMRAVGAHATSPEDIRVHNPAFDVTPAALITAIITDRGVFAPDTIGVQRG